jgi:hypothetical protein
MKNYYDGSKNGYYRIASRRIIAFVFLRTALAVGRIVNCESGKRGLRNIKIEDYYDQNGARNALYYAKHRQEIGAWNISTTFFKYVTLLFPLKYVRKIEVWIQPDADFSTSYIYPLYSAGGGFSSTGFAIDGGIGNYKSDIGVITLYAGVWTNGGTVFKNANFDSNINRGWCVVEYET